MARAPGERRRAAGAARRHDGFSLAETLVAVGISATMVAGLLPLYFQAVTSTLWAHDQSVASMLAVAQIERLRGLPFEFDVAPPAGVFRHTDLSTNVAMPGLEEGGAGLTASPPGALLRDTDGYVDYLDAAGRWVGNWAAPSADAAYVRRWAITPLPASPEDAIVLQVLVAPIALERRLGPRVDAARRPGDCWLTLVRARVQ